MKYVTANCGVVAVGLAFGPIVPEFVSANPGLIDYVEIPFEQLRHSPESGNCARNPALRQHVGGRLRASRRRDIEGHRT
jgi:hypothetical protein